MTPSSFNDLADRLRSRKILKKYHLNKIGVFGSFARGEKSKDIDFYVDNNAYKMEDLLKLKKDLEKITETEVDIMLKKYANPIILYRAQKDMKYVTE